NAQFRVAAEHLRSLGKFEEASTMFARSADHEENVMGALQCLLELCKIYVLNGIIMDTTSLTELRRLLDKTTEVTKFESQSLKGSRQWNMMKEEIRLYSAYVNRDLDAIQQCIRFFNECKGHAAECRAILLWLKIRTNADNQAEYWREKLKYLLRLSKLAHPFMESTRNGDNTEEKEACKDFENVFCVREMEDHQNKRQIPLQNSLINNMGENNVIDITGDWNVYNERIVRQTIIQLFSSYMYEFIWEAGEKCKSIPDITSYICYWWPCEDRTCQRHHMEPTRENLHRRLSLACLHYTVIQQLDVLELTRKRRLKEEQKQDAYHLQKFWTENLVKYHVRYQLPKASFPELMYDHINRFSDVRGRISEHARKQWLGDDLQAQYFANLLKCMFVSLQLQDEKIINKFCDEISKSWYPVKNGSTEESANTKGLPIGFEYNKKGDKVVPIAVRLSKFINHLKSGKMITAIIYAKRFIAYALRFTDEVNLLADQALGDLVSLMEFTTSLAFFTHPERYDFYLPRSYLYDYYTEFSENFFSGNLRLSSQDDERNIESHRNLIWDFFWQARHLICILVDHKPIDLDQQIALIIVRRLIRVLVLICLNEPSYEAQLVEFLKRCEDKPHLFQNYLNKTDMESLAKTLDDELKETDFDCLVRIELEGFSEILLDIAKMPVYKTDKSFHQQDRIFNDRIECL
ncbi:10141_t:CDS:1, partial [Paraglomus brasilianum]